jgi:hypothetical protein
VRGGGAEPGDTSRSRGRLDGDRTSVTLTPGLRTHVGNDWSFVAGLPTPVTDARVADLGMIFWFVKAW